MDWIREYLLRLTAAALFCGLISGLLGKNGALGTLVKLMTGIFMTLTIVSPLLKVQISNFTDYLGNLSVDADSVIAEGENVAADTMGSIIKSETEAYILDKADSFGAELAVEVSVDGSDVPVPCAVRISGSISPYGRKQLEQIIADELGIALEDQTWIG